MAVTRQNKKLLKSLFRKDLIEPEQCRALTKHAENRIETDDNKETKASLSISKAAETQKSRKENLKRF